MQKKFETNQTKIKGGCQSGRKVAFHDSKSDLPQVMIDSSWHQNNKSSRGAYFPGTN